MYSELILFLCAIIIIEAKITINVKAGKNKQDVEINYSGYDIDIIGDKEIELFNINKINLKKAIKAKYDMLPRDVFLKSPTPWGDLYKTYNWEQVSRILKVKSAKLKESTVKSMVVLAHDFENKSNITIKANTGISQTVENTISTTWSRSRETTVSQDIEYDLNVILAKISGTTSFSYSSSVGESEEKSETVTIGTTTNVETELHPGQAVTAVLSANRYKLEIEVIYLVTLRGNVAVNFRKAYNGHHFYGPSIESVLTNGGLNTEMTITENIQLGLYTDGSLIVYDKVTGLPV
ncbi:spherulin-2A-like [Vanessa cardui]|uniref:spherulin-2A-like n=1 Tax=Vanessa cardui TaxID=171605 RepID=UPI001F1423C7|nr:spherulin-2A-like [Vanessa cardui]